MRTFEPVPPAERPLRERRTARVLLVDDRDEVLLFVDSDPGVPGTQWWITPGGGVDEGETDRDAAARELLEETGLRVDPAALVGPVAVRRVVHGYSDVVVDQEDVFFACWVASFEVSDDGHTDEERRTMVGHRWWPRADLASTSDEIWPAELLDLLTAADEHRAGRLRGAATTPLRLDVAEESTVPASRGHLRAAGAR